MCLSQELRTKDLKNKKCSNRLSVFLLLFYHVSRVFFLRKPTSFFEADLLGFVLIQFLQNYLENRFQSNSLQEYFSAFLLRVHREIEIMRFWVVVVVVVEKLGSTTSC